MKLVTYAAANGAKLGALVDGGVLDLADAGGRTGNALPDTMQALIEAGPAAWDAARAVIVTRPDESVVAGAQLLTPSQPRSVCAMRACSWSIWKRR